MGATPSPVINSALSAAPSAPTSSSGGLNATKANADVNDNGSNEFMQLLNTLMNDDASTSATSMTQPVSAEKAKQDDSQPVVTADTVAQWLLSPFPATANPVTTNATQPSTATDEVTDALTPANNAAANPLLLQNLKRFGNDKLDQATKSVNQKTSDDSMPAFLLGGQTTQSPLESMLSKVGGSGLSMPTDNNDKAVNKASADSSSNSPPLLQAMSSFHAALNDVNNSDASSQYKIHSQVGSRDWVNEVGNRLTMMTTDKVQSASLQLTPDNLGPVQVKIDVNNNQASVWFTADHPDTRTALEQSLPQLRELFASQGMSLMDAGVFGQSSQQQPSAPFNRDSTSSFGMNDMSNDVTSTQQILRVGLLDTYA